MLLHNGIGHFASLCICKNVNSYNTLISLNIYIWSIFSVFDRHMFYAMWHSNCLRVGSYKIVNKKSLTSMFIKWLQCDVILYWSMTQVSNMLCAFIWVMASCCDIYQIYQFNPYWIYWCSSYCIVYIWWRVCSTHNPNIGCKSAN